MPSPREAQKDFCVCDRQQVIGLDKKDCDVRGQARCRPGGLDFDTPSVPVRADQVNLQGAHGFLGVREQVHLDTSPWRSVAAAKGLV